MHSIHKYISNVRHVHIYRDICICVCMHIYIYIYTHTTHVLATLTPRWHGGHPLEPDDLIMCIYIYIYMYNVYIIYACVYIYIYIYIINYIVSYYTIFDLSRPVSKGRRSRKWGGVPYFLSLLLVYTIWCYIILSISYYIIQYCLFTGIDCLGEAVPGTPAIIHIYISKQSMYIIISSTIIITGNISARRGGRGPLASRAPIFFRWELRGSQGKEVWTSVNVRVEHVKNWERSKINTSCYVRPPKQDQHQLLRTTPIPWDRLSSL